MPVLRKSMSAIKPKAKAKPKAPKAKRVSKGGKPDYRIHPINSAEEFENLPKPRSNRDVDESLRPPQSNRSLSQKMLSLLLRSKKTSVHPSPTSGTGGKKKRVVKR